MKTLKSLTNTKSRTIFILFFFIYGSIHASSFSTFFSNVSTGFWSSAVLVFFSWSTSVKNNMSNVRVFSVSLDSFDFCCQLDSKRGHINYKMWYMVDISKYLFTFECQINFVISFAENLMSPRHSTTMTTRAINI